MALVKLSHGTAVNKESLKYITIETKQQGGKAIYAITLKLDDNSEHWVTGFDNKEEALTLIKTYVKGLNEAE